MAPERRAKKGLALETLLQRQLVCVFIREIQVGDEFTLAMAR
jgi:hypothetical protein